MTCDDAVLMRAFRLFPSEGKRIEVRGSKSHVLLSEASP